MKGWRRLLRIWLLGLVIVAGACRDTGVTPAPTMTAAPAYEPVFESADCAFARPPAIDVRCGYVVVPENRSDLSGTVRLHVAVVASRAADPAPDPLLVLTGGPGGHALDGATFYVDLFNAFLAERDLILFDQRGVGYSQPSLDCPEVEAHTLANIEVDLADDEARALLQAAYDACRDRLLAAGVDLSAYNSAASAADVDDIRRALDYASVNLYGISYGTRLALTVLRDFGAAGAVRSVVLDSVVGPQERLLAAWGTNAGRAFDLLFDRCAADAACADAYPQLESRFYDLVAQLNAAPLTVIVSDRINQTTYRVPVDGDLLIATLFQAMYDPVQIVHLPRLIDQLIDGRTFLLGDMLADQLVQPGFASEGMRLSVQCYEEMPFVDAAAVTANAAALPPLLGDFFQSEVATYEALCADWPAGTAPPLEDEPVVSAVPVLLLAGSFDPVTPPSFAQAAAATLSQSYYFEFAGVAHGVVGVSDCADQIMRAFVDRPDANPDVGCDRDQTLGFVVR